MTTLTNELEAPGQETVVSPNASICSGCLHRIGEVAYLGVSSRELTSTKDILLKVDIVDQACQCLGLAEEHVKKLPHGNGPCVVFFAPDH